MPLTSEKDFLRNTSILRLLPQNYLFEIEVIDRYMHQFAYAF